MVLLEPSKSPTCIVVVGGGAAPTVTVTVAVLLSAAPSLALYVNVWMPVASGV
jgi:hypothetical protein